MIFQRLKNKHKEDCEDYNLLNVKSSSKKVGKVYFIRTQRLSRDVEYQGNWRMGG